MLIVKLTDKSAFWVLSSKAPGFTTKEERERKCFHGAFVDVGQFSSIRLMGCTNVHDVCLPVCFRVEMTVRQKKSQMRTKV